MKALWKLGEVESKRGKGAPLSNDDAAVPTHAFPPKGCHVKPFRSMCLMSVSPKVHSVWSFSGRLHEPNNYEKYDSRTALRQPQQTDVPSAPTSGFLMPSTRSDTHVQPSPRSKKGQDFTSRWLDKNNHLEADPIEIDSDDEFTASAQPHRQQARHPSITSRRDEKRHQNRPILSNRTAEEGHLLGDFKSPKDAVSVVIPRSRSDNNSSNNMGKIATTKFHGGGLKYLNTLDAKLASKPQGSKANFVERRTSENRKQLSPRRTQIRSTEQLTEPPRKKQRVSGSSDILNSTSTPRTTTRMPQEEHNEIFSSPPMPSWSTDGMQKPRMDIYVAARSGPTPQVGKGIDSPPFELLRPTNTASKSFEHREPLRELLCISGSDDDTYYTKDARQDRRRRQQADDVEDEEAQLHGLGSSHTRTRESSSSDTVRNKADQIAELEHLIPEALIRQTPSEASSPDILQDEHMKQSAQRKDGKPQEQRNIGSKTANFMKGFLNSSVMASYKNSKPAPGSLASGRWIPLKKFRLQGLHHPTLPSASGYIFAVDDRSKTFHFEYESQELNSELILETPLSKIRKVTTGNGKSSKLLIEMSYAGNEVNKFKLDMESEKQAFDLVGILQKLDATVTISTRPDEWMEKMFTRGSTSVKSTIAAQSSAAGQNRVRPTSKIESSYFPDSRRRAEVRRDSTESLYSNQQQRTSNGTSPSIRDKASRPISAVERRQQMLEEQMAHGAEARSKNKPSEQKRVVEIFAPQRSTRSHTARASPAWIKQQALRPVRIPYSQTGQLGPKWKTPLTYPKSGSKRETVNFDDLYRLDDDEFLNDNLVGFFLRYLQHHLEVSQPETFKRLHFFNSFFHERLRQNSSDKKNINFDAVKKWTSKIDIFNRDFVIVPVNENLHWYIAIICNLPWFKKQQAGEEESEDEGDVGVQSMGNPTDPGDQTPPATIDPEGLDEPEATRSQLQDLSMGADEKSDSKTILTPEQRPPSSSKSDSSGKKRRVRRKSVPPAKLPKNSKRPVIITLDSLGMGRSGTCVALRSYVVQEAKDKKNWDIDGSLIKAMTVKGIPTQSNYSDCGLFVCAYMERFAVDPGAFKRSILWQKPQAWPKMHSEDLRSRMRDLIMKLHREQEGQTQDEPISGVGEILLGQVVSERSPPRLPPRQSKSFDEVHEVQVSSKEPTIRHRDSLEMIRTSPIEHVDPPRKPKFQEIMKIRKSNLSGEAAKDSAKNSLPSAVHTTHSKITIDDSDDEDVQFRLQEGSSDNPQELAELLRAQASADRHVRETTASTDFLSGPESYSHCGESGRSHDDDDMIIKE